MKYQIYLQKDVSEIINALCAGLDIKPSTFIKEHLETSFRSAYQSAIKITKGKGDKIDGQQKKK